MVAISTTLGIPVSATQTLVGAVFGVGLARGIEALNLEVMRNIFFSWVLTIPITAGLATLFFICCSGLCNINGNHSIPKIRRFPCQQR